MSMKKLAVLAAVHNHGLLNRTMTSPTPGSPPAPVHGVNVMLGGAMISGIILVVFVFCYCCHKTKRKSQSHLVNYWRENGYSMEIYTVESENQQCYDEELSADVGRYRPPTPGPPPAYDAIVHKQDVDETGLPSYESAVKLQVVTGDGYV